MHYHVTRFDYDTRTAHENGPVLIGEADDYRSARGLAEADEKQFRTPAADRFVTHDYRFGSCNLVHQ
jgi:hypothetical protein